ncbi:MAG: protein-disulfide reductase DsbD domain-containing protein [Chitinophagia bacterium]|jgi:thiol:disulfide interchange protein DsbD
MKKIGVIFCSLVFVLNVNAQKLNPVKWTFEAVKKSDKQYELQITANVESPWHIYSQFVKGGPVPTSISFKANPLLQVKGVAKEIGKIEKKFDKNFNAEIAYFSNKVQFAQLVNLKVASKTKIAGEVEYMVCNDERCLPPTKVAFEIALQ